MRSAASARALATIARLPWRSRRRADGDDLVDRRRDGLLGGEDAGALDAVGDERTSRRASLAPGGPS